MSSATGSQQWMYNSDDAIYNGVVSTSARFDDDGGANYLYKTFDANGNRQQFTIAFWMKYNEDGFEGGISKFFSKDLQKKMKKEYRF